MMSSFFGFVDYDHPLVPAREYAEYQARKTAVENLVKPLKAAVREIEEPYRRAIFEKKLKTFPADIQASLKTPEAQRTAGQKLLATQVLSITSAGRRELALSSPDREQIGKLEAQIRELERQLPPPPPMASGIRDGDYRFTPDGNGDEPVPGTTANRISADFPGSYVPKPGAKYVPPPLVFPVGDPGGKEVQPGFLTVIDQGKKPTEHRPSNNLSTSGRRRALAEWIASEDNPLTARVMVNRLWQHHFGRGIVSTPSNFGKMGSRPANPELLDWLATEFINGGWSTKKIQRIIMTSQTYQMASDYGDTDNLARDADNTCLWRFPLQRVEAEAVRDVILNASGNLNLKAGGPPFFPAVPPAVREDVKKIGRWELTKEDPTTWRRGVYSYYKRAMKYPMFEVLDVPDSNITCERRSTTTVPTQALTLMNNEFVLMQTRFFAKRVLESAGDNTAKQISTAYQIALSREPTTVELRGNQEFLSKQKVWHEHGHSTTDRPAEDALTDLCAVILNLNEFVFIN
jgi:hypothetical protein